MFPVFAASSFDFSFVEVLTNPITIMIMIAIGLIGLWELMGLRYIPNDRVGVVEKLWSPKGSVSEGKLLALNGEAGYQADLLRGGIHFGYWRFQYRIHKLPLVAVPQGQIGYVYARDGEPLTASQTLGRMAHCNNFQDARPFLAGGEGAAVGQRGRQRAILREGVYAINQALFVVVTASNVYRMALSGGQELQNIMGWQQELLAIDGFSPVVVGRPVEIVDPIHPETTTKVDSIGI